MHKRKAIYPGSFDPLTNGHVNITRVTTMGPGQYALYPHFRSDRWMNVLVRTLGTTREHVVASDAARLQ